MEEREEYLANETEMLRALLLEAERPEADAVEVQIARNGRVVLRFRVRPLSEREYMDCRERVTKYRRDRQFGGLRMPAEVDLVRLNSLLIHTATVEEDRARLWDNKELQRQADVLSGPDLIDKVLRAGEKEAVVAKIDEISGYGADLVETAKN